MSPANAKLSKTSISRMIHGAMGLIIRLLSVGLLLGLSIVLARGLGPEGFGTYTYAMSWVLMFSMIQRSGLAILLVREVAVYNSQQQFENLNGVVFRGWQVTFGICAMAAILLAGICEALVCFRNDPQFRLIHLTLPLLPLIGATSIMEAVTRGFGKVLAGQLGEFIVRHAVHLIVFLTLSLGILPWAASPQTAIGAAIIGSLVALILSFAIYKTVYRPQITKKKEYDDKRWAKSLALLTSSTGISAINGYIAIVIVGIWLVPSEIAALQIAIQMTILISMGVVVINIMQAADVAKLFAAGNIREVQNFASRGCWLSLGFGATVSIVFVAGGQRLIDFLFGSGYEETYSLVLILMIGQLFNVATGSPGTILNAGHHEKHVLTSVLVSTLVIVITIIPLAYFFGTAGAATSMSIGLIVWKGVAVGLLKKETGIICLPLNSIFRNPTID